MRYVLAYFALMIGLSGLGMLISGRPLGFLLVLVALGLVYWIIRLQQERQRDRHYGQYGPAIEGYGREFAAAARELDAELPEDALDSPALVELLSGEDAARAEQIRAEYARLRQRFLEWQREVQRMQEQQEADAVGLPGPFAENYERLDRELSALVEQVARLDARAAQAKSFGENPLEEIARAALELEQAASLCRASFGGEVPAELTADLAQGHEKLEEARGGLQKGAERPLAAARLAREAYALARGVSRRAREVAERPREAGERRGELESEAKGLAARVSSAKAKLALASAHYAPACLQPVEGLDAGADQALEHARSLIGSGDDSLLAEAGDSLRRANELLGRIEGHLAELEDAAANTPALVEQAELAIDRAWAANRASGDVDAAKDQIVTRAEKLAKEARAELGEARPDWLHATSLAKRSHELVGELSAARAVPAPVVSSGGAVESARRAAESAVAEAVPLVGSLAKRTGNDNMAALYLERAQNAYADGVEHQADSDGASDPHSATQAALESFQIAVDAAKAAEEHARQLGAGADRRPTPRWGRFGTAFESD